jgi:hypothetical protein
MILNLVSGYIGILLWYIFARILDASEYSAFVQFALPKTARAWNGKENEVFIQK